MNIIEIAEQLKSLFLNDGDGQEIDRLHFQLEELLKDSSLVDTRSVRAVLTDDVWFDFSINLKRQLFKRLLSLGDRTLENLTIYSNVLGMDYYDKSEMREIVEEINKLLPPDQQVDVSKWS